MKRLPTIVFGLIGLVLAGFLLNGCKALKKKRQAGAAVEVHGQYLYKSTLDALTVGLKSEDSLRVTQEYIRQWAKDILLYDAVKEGKTGIPSDQIEQMVEDYRRTLYAHAYGEWLAEQQMSKTVLDSTVQQVYDQMPERFLLNESVLKGMLLILPKGAPNSNKLRTWMNEESLDEIEKYAYQYANGYELFQDKWLTTTEVINRMPIEREDLESRLKTKPQIEVSDSLKIYIMQVTDKQLRGTPMPMEYARSEIEKIILSERQVEFLQKEGDRIYDEAVRNGEVKIY